MHLRAVGKLIAERRRARRLTLLQLAAAAGVARSTLAALEAGKLPELGFNRVVRICAAVDLAVDVRPPVLEAPLMDHRHLTAMAGRELTKAAIDDVVTRGDVRAWRGLFQAIRADGSGRLARRTMDVLRSADVQDPRVKALTALVRKAARRRRSAG